MMLSPLPQNLTEGSAGGFWDGLKMVIEVAIFAAMIYVVLRFLRATRGSVIIRGLALLLHVVRRCVLHLRRTRFQLTAPVVAWSSRSHRRSCIGLVVVFHPEIRRAIVHLGDAPIFGRFFRRDTKIAAAACCAPWRV